jgi:acyl carrier protein
MENTGTIEERVIGVILEECPYLTRDEIVRGSFLKEDLRIDELDRLELVMAIEDEFGIQITDAEVESCITVGNCIDLVNKKLA